MFKFRVLVKNAPGTTPERGARVLCYKNTHALLVGVCSGETFRAREAHARARSLSDEQ